MTEFPGKGRRILVVEDDATNRSVLARQLAMVGVDAEMAGNGMEGLERWRGGDFALVLSDLHMPVMDGFGLVRAIRNEEAAIRTPVLAFSADVRIGQAEKARDAGFDEFLAKPMQLDGLRAVLGRWLAAPATPASARAAPGLASQARADGILPCAEFDAGALRELVGDEPAVVLEILAYFDEVATGIRADLLAAAAAGDAAGAGMLAHRLKSSARSVGAAPLGLLCARLEEHAGSVQGAGFAALVDEVVQALDAALVAMRRWRAVGGARGQDMTRYAL
ncbi:response regulator [Luteimonas sp. MC1750]|uniref:response regulator n=1 Tax=Luteimonas sp. MC1750 TaxID=2799326 RepID=UPI0018F0A22A|nr:response regulator [Luteimonas sp. MC1750]MBJ6984177.1 response regulator [Luteimonas sp. MC1750]QQO07034.1 response regulator [Luteimonas sp. MC1750]